MWITCLVAGAFLVPIVEASKNQSKVEDIFSKFQQSDYRIEYERTEVVRTNKQYMKQFKMVNFKFNRTRKALNATFEYNMDVGNDLEAVVQAYKFMSNEYRLFPLRFQINVCAAIRNNLGGVNTFLACGNFTECEFKKGNVYHVCNFHLDQSRFPPLIPDGSYMVEMQVNYRSVEVFLTRTYGSVIRPFLEFGNFH